MAFSHTIVLHGSADTQARLLREVVTDSAIETADGEGYKQH